MEAIRDELEQGRVLQALALLVIVGGHYTPEISVESQDDDDGFVLIFDNLSLERRLLFEIPESTPTVCLVIIGDNRVVKRSLKPDFELQELKSDFRWLAGMGE